MLRRLAAAYRRQALVPFIGAGMSVRSLEQWAGFVKNLEAEARPDEIAVEHLEEVEGLVCECGHGFVVISVSELDEPARSGRLISLPERRRSSARRAA